LASAAGLRVHELSAGSTSLEQLFLDLTQDSTEQPEQNRRDEGEAR
ncbi:ABC transporter ATP-binding protein, partial [Streptomyces fulvissimus]|nr:ABC transporter ATP-binding protein [Streptomyces microflavus]